MSATDKITADIQAWARQAGFAAVGIASAKASPAADLYHHWLELGNAGMMDYLRRNMPQRLRPDVLVPDSKSVICLAVGYAAPGGQKHNPQKLIASYAVGRDYHKVLKKRCIALMDRIRQAYPQFAGRAFVDSAPIMERSLAASCSLGSIAHNGCLVVPGLGSYVLLCEIVCNLPLAIDQPAEPAEQSQNKSCNSCGRCLSACPTGAIAADGMIDARRCISYLTIEQSGEIAPELWPTMGTHVFGCDACQDACHLNLALPAGDAELTAREKIASLQIADILEWTHDDWDEITRGSALRRASYAMFIRNAIIAAGNSADSSLIEPLQALRACQPNCGQLIDWAVGRLAGGLNRI
jgi:epoxyqueuosine reductase